MLDLTRLTPGPVHDQGGSLRVGTRVLALPSRQAGAVKTLAVDGAPAALAIAGDSADVSLTDGADTVRTSPYAVVICCNRWSSHPDQAAHTGMLRSTIPCSANAVL